MVFAAASELVSGAVTAVLTILVVVIVIVAAGFWLLVRRRARGGGSDGRGGALTMRANILLVRLDDTVKSSEDELGFAIAQFGEQRARVFTEAVSEARAALTEAFRLKQQLDDSVPDSEAQKRDWNARVIHLCESAQSSLNSQAAVFAALREQEKRVPQTLAAVRELIAATSARLPEASAALAGLEKSFAAQVVAIVKPNAAEAERLLAAAAESAKAADAQIASDDSAQADSVQAAQSDAQNAAQLLDAIGNLEKSLAEATERLEPLVAAAQKDLAEAAATRDAPPDPDSGAGIGRAMAQLEQTLAALPEGDPVGAVELLQQATAGLDAALAVARNQAQRLEHARTALTGALLTARSQIKTTDEFIATKRGGVGADARTRLAEAQRLLMVAEAESDPVVALDTARSSATYSRDADALARYDLLG